MQRVKILGAGPSGLSAAINLARSGYEAVVFEKRRCIGGRFKGDLQGLENWSASEDVRRELNNYNIEINFDLTPFKDFVVSNLTKESDFSLDRPAFYLLRRGPVPRSLDRGLEEQSLDLGVEIRYHETIPEGDADIVATGPVGETTPALVSGVAFDTSLEDTAVVIFSDELAYKGYSYFLVAEGHGCICSVVFDDFGRTASCFRRTAEFFSEAFDFDMESPRRISGVGTFSVNGVLKKGNRMYVGEAAGLQDFLWGFGIRKAIASGYLASRCLIEGKDYQKVARGFFRKKLKASLVNRFLWESFRFGDYSLILDILKDADDPLSLLLSFSNFNPLQMVVYPFARRSMNDEYVNIIT